MQPGQKKAHAEIGKQDRAKARHCQPGDGAPLPALDQPGMQEGSIDEPGDEGGRLLGVPAPVMAPGGLGPHRPGENAQGQEDKADDGSPINQAVQQR